MEVVSTDMLGPLPSGEKLFVVVDDFSRYFEVEYMRKTDASHVIAVLRKMFYRLGFPRRMLSDNGPPYNSKELADFCKEFNIELIHSVPLQPRGNGAVEIINKSLVKRIIISVNLGRNIQEDLDQYIFTHRTTPHSSTGVAPLELFSRRKIRDKLPSVSQLKIPLDTSESVRDRDSLMKQKGKEYADKKYGYKKCDLVPGDKVLMRRSQRTKWQSPNFDKEFTVVEKKGPALTIVAKDGTRFIRDASKLVPLGVASTSGDQGAPSDLTADDLSESVDEIPLTSSSLFTGVPTSQSHLDKTQRDQLYDTLSHETQPQHQSDVTSDEPDEQQSFQTPFAPETASTPMEQNPVARARARTLRPPLWMADYTR